LLVKLHRGRLDQQIAEGCGAGAGEERALRASQLVAMPARRRVARSLRQAVDAAERPTTVSAAIPLSRSAVLRWREGLLGLAERLEGPGPVNARGVARALVLLTNVEGPLYERAAAGSMGEAVWWIADGLQP
jgi:hypothetical protein